MFHFHRIDCLLLKLTHDLILDSFLFLTATSAGSVLTGLAGEADIEITVRWRKTTCIVKLEANATFDNLKREICNNWDQLIPVDFAIYVDKKIITSDADLVLFLNSSDRVLKVETQTVDFSEIKLKTVKDWAGIGDIEEDKDQFGSAVIDESIPGVKAIIDHAVADLKLKDALYGPIIDCCEASVREYISAILTAAAGIATQIKLSAEREISGRKATGPLDYAMLYKQFCIAIITEAKRDRLSSGVVQNVAQLVASRETYLFDIQDRKRGYMDMAGQIAQVPSTGIISTGKEWLLLRYFLHPAPLVVKSAVYGLPIVEISTADTDCELRRHVLVLLGKIVGALSLQKEAFDANEFTKKQRV